MKILIIGGGGHGAVVGDAVCALADAGTSIEVVGYLDDDAGKAGQPLPGGRVIGTVALHPGVEHDGIVIAVGDQSVRPQLFRRMSDAGEQLVSVVHPAAVVAAGVSVGFGTMVMAGVVVNTGARIGANVILNTSCSVDHHCVVEDHVHIAPGARLGGGVSVRIGALVGLGAVVLPGCDIGPGAVVGAGAVVISNVPPGVIVVGNPAREIPPAGRAAVPFRAT